VEWTTLDGENGEKRDVEEPVTFSKAIKMLSQMFGKLCDQNFKMPVAVKIRNEVCSEIGEVTKIIQILSSLGPGLQARMKSPILFW
jgi:hypothetical protein